MSNTDEINQLRLRLSEAQKLADMQQDRYMLAAANVVRIRQQIEDLLHDSPEPGWAAWHRSQKELRETIDE